MLDRILENRLGEIAEQIKEHYESGEISKREAYLQIKDAWILEILARMPKHDARNWK